MKRFGNIILIAVIVFVAAGCGAIFNGTSKSIDVQSAPAGASIKADPMAGTYTTPTSIKLERKNSYVFTFEKEGYEPATATVKKNLQAGILIMDVLFTGLIGVIVDAATGAWYNLSPANVTVALTKKEGANIEGPDKILVDLKFIENEQVRVASSEQITVSVKVED